MRSQNKMNKVAPHPDTPAVRVGSLYGIGDPYPVRPAILAPDGSPVLYLPTFFGMTPEKSKLAKFLSYFLRF
jgi:hypothetical protein